jgi:hypothetical protein
MLENYAKVQQALAERQAAAAEIKFKAYVAAVPALTWTDIKADINDLKAANKLRTAQLESNFLNAVTNQLATKAQLKDAKEALAEIDKQKKDAEVEQDQWKAREELFKGFLQFYTEHSGDFSKPDKDLLKQANQEILGRKIPGKTNTVGSLLSDDLKNLEHFDIAAATKPYTLDFFDPRKAPGIKVQLLSLGEDLAKARIKRLQLDLTWLDSLKASWTNQQDALKLQNSHVTKAMNDMGSYLDSPNVIGSNMEQFRAASATNAATARAELMSSSRGLIYFLLAITYDESLVRELETHPSNLGHEHAIRLNQINEQEREVFVLRGLESLNAYHQGGIRPDEVANLLRAAEAAGIGVIGAGVLR